MLTNHIIWKVNPCNTLVQDDLKLPDDGGGIPKTQGRSWQFESRLWNLLSIDEKLVMWSTASCALTLTCRPSKKIGLVIDIFCNLDICGDHRFAATSRCDVIPSPLSIVKALQIVQSIRTQLLTRNISGVEPCTSKKGLIFRRYPTNLEGPTYSGVGKAKWGMEIILF